MSSFTHIAILGRQPELGLIELESRLGSEAMQPFGRHAVLLASNPGLDQLGGALKIGRIIGEGKPEDLLTDIIDFGLLPTRESKLPFALSFYGVSVAPRFVLSSGLQLKTRLRQGGSSIRLITPTKGTEVTAAQLKHNKVLEDGFELMVIISKQRMLIAMTEQVQDIDWYSRRDYDRPARSAKVGMLPPKLARIMVNTTSEELVVDPFCGTGVVPQEALLLGRQAYGSDLSAEMTDASRQNLTWLQDQSQAGDVTGQWSIDEPADAREVILPRPDCAVVTEGYLGTNQTREPTPYELDELRAQLLPLYRGFLSNMAEQLAPGSQLAVCVPAWRLQGAWNHLGVVDELGALGYTMKVFKHAPGLLLYARPDAIVGRQLLLLRKS